MSASQPGSPSRRHTLLLVHAHPDDECSGTGGLIVRCAQEGHTTVLITCTTGDRGEANGLRLLPRERAEDRRLLAEVRQRELEAAVRILGLSHHHQLGYGDSGMKGWKSNGLAEVFANADLGEAAEKIARFIREYRPDVMITYDEKGGYGHPDHVMAHRAAMAAAGVAADRDHLADSGLAPWRVKKIYHTAWARSRLLRTWRWMRRIGKKTPLDDPDFDETQVGTPDEEITTRIDIRSVLKKKWRALFSHKSQMGNNFFWWFFRLAGRWIFPDESFVLVRSEVPSSKAERSIFEGL
ncbi:MAG: PIG-L family deacetylase [Nitrospinota bacterium]